MNRKAVSPMVATMLLIFFAIALGTVIMTWGSSYAAQQGHAEEKREEAAIRCDRFVKLEAVKDGLDICVSPIKKRLRYTVKNAGDITIDGMRIILIGKKNFETTFFDVDDANIPKGEMQTFNQNYDYPRLGLIGQLEISPKIFLRDSEELYRCRNKVVVEEVPEC